MQSRMEEMIGASEERFQSLLHQVLQHVTQLVSSVPSRAPVINVDEEDEAIG